MTERLLRPSFTAMTVDRILRLTVARNRRDLNRLEQCRRQDVTLSLSILASTNSADRHPSNTISAMINSRTMSMSNAATTMPSPERTLTTPSLRCEPHHSNLDHSRELQSPNAARLYSASPLHRRDRTRSPCRRSQNRTLEALASTALELCPYRGPSHIITKPSCLFVRRQTHRSLAMDKATSYGSCATFAFSRTTPV